MEILNTPTAELERAAVEQGPNHSRQLLPAARAVNTVARKTLTVADTVKHDMRGLSESAPEKLAAKALEEAPSLLLTGPSTGMKLANAATGMVMAYGKHGMVPAAIAAGAVPGNSAAANAAEIAIQENLPFGGFRASGGPVLPGRAYIAGELGPETVTDGKTVQLIGQHGPEVIVPKKEAVVIPSKLVYELTSPKTGQTYRANFDSDPQDADIEEAVAAFDAEEFAARGGEGDPNAAMQ